jgi:hypothetical protein
VAQKTSSIPSPEEQLSQLFGSYKAEWLKEQLFDLFTAPAYLPELTTPRPCLLMGGRGTGKTTVLRGLSYEGQLALAGGNAEAVRQLPYFGFYYRVNTNRVTAFKGPELAENTWIKLFGHYFNLLMCDLVIQFLEWYQLKTGVAVDPPPSDCRKIGLSLHLEDTGSVRELANQIEAARIAFEAHVNNIADGDRPLLSLQGAPLDSLLGAVSKLAEFRGKHFFFLIDEYENFEDYQQQVVNTLIKHSGQIYSFKVGVRELGWRRRATLNANEQLVTPADFVLIDIAKKLEGEEFGRFALGVCKERVARLRLPGQKRVQDVVALLPGLSEDDEARELGIEDKAAEVKDQLVAAVPKMQLEALNRLSDLETYMIGYWAKSQGQSVADVYFEMLREPKEWADRFANYKHSLLYTLHQRKRGIVKYYSGWGVYVQLAAANIRYLLALVDQALLFHLREDKQLGTAVSPTTQTYAAQQVGRMILADLEGLSVHGAELTKLVLGLGRVFQVMAANPEGHAPEVNQFHLSAESASAAGAHSDSDARAEELLNAAVMHLALLRSLGNKLADVADTREYDYMVHPIFAAFFAFSYRRKRKMLLHERDLIGLVTKPREAIREILRRSKRSAEDPVPDQLRLFESFYIGDS